MDAEDFQTHNIRITALMQAIATLQHATNLLHTAPTTEEILARTKSFEDYIINGKQ